MHASNRKCYLCEFFVHGSAGQTSTCKYFWHSSTVSERESEERYRDLVGVCLSAR